MTSSVCEHIAATQRLDKWLWCARFFKTRSLAAKIIRTSPVRVGRSGRSMRVEKPSFLIQAGDEVAFMQERKLRRVKVAACAQRRGPASEAADLFEDLTPPEPSAAQRLGHPRQGRPSKQARRAISALKTAGAFGRDPSSPQKPTPN